MNTSRMIRGWVLIGALACAWLAAGIARSAGPVVGWGLDNLEQASPPASVNGTSGTAIAIAVGGGHSLAIAAPEPASIGLGTVSLGSLLALARRRRSS
jgi:hypothetical protein